MSREGQRGLFEKVTAVPWRCIWRGEWGFEDGEGIGGLGGRLRGGKMRCDVEVKRAREGDRVPDLQ